MTIEKCSVPIVSDDKGEPIALVYFSKNRERVIYTLVKADEDTIVKLLEGKPIV